MAKFLVVGDATVDQMYFVEEFPEPGTEVSAYRSTLEPGGSGGTVATVLARLGNQTRIATRVGTDPFADVALRNLVASGVDLSLLQRHATLQTSSVTLLVTPDGQRTMLSSAGASRELDVARLDTASVTDADALVMSAYSLVAGRQQEYALTALRLAAAARLTTFIDLGTGAVNALGSRLIDHVRGVDYLLMNEHELYEVTGLSTISAAVLHLRSLGIDNIVVKVGENGSILFTPDLSELVEAHPVAGVIDSTGAGDYYTAAFAHAVMDGYDLLTAARMANVAGALNTTSVGAQSVDLDVELLEHVGADLATVPA
ncbi:MAG TPA: carbohydrate kinase family protein [Trueperaceae bacterium]|nr:carbohydrate kinase family protein [Trueperaceae bacterium]